MSVVRRNLIGMSAGLLIAGLLVLGAYQLVHRGGQRRADDERRASLLLGLDGASEVVGLRLETAAGVAIAASRPPAGPGASRPGRWQLIEPLPGGADQEAWSRLAELLATLRHERALDAPADLAPFDLSAPSHHLGVRTAAGKSLRVAVGKRSSFNRRVYAQVEGDRRLFLVDAELRERAERDLFAMRQKTLTTLDASEVQAFEVLRRGQPRYRAEREGQGWTLTSPRRAPADANLVNAVLGALVGLRAQSFAVDQPAAADYGRFGLAPEAWRVRLARNDGSLQVLLLGQARGAVYAALDEQGPIMAVGEAVLAQLGRGPDELRDLRLLPFAREQAAAIEVHDGQSLRLRLVRADHEQGRWHFDSPQGPTASAGRAASLLYRLSTLRAAAVLAEQATPAQRRAASLDPPARRLVLHDVAGQTVAALALGRPQRDGRYPAQAQGAELIGLISAADHDRLHLDPAYYRPENEERIPFD